MVSVSNATELLNLSTVQPLPEKVNYYTVTQIVLIAIVAGTLSIVTVVGNIMVMISFKIDKQLQTISNYFLFSLAVADFAIGLISMPLFTISTLMGKWPLGPHICDTWLALDYLASNASVLNLLIISFDRYFSVTRPLTYRARRTTNKAAIMISKYLIFIYLYIFLSYFTSCSSSSVIWHVYARIHSIFFCLLLNL